MGKLDGRGHLFFHRFLGVDSKSPEEQTCGISAGFSEGENYGQVRGFGGHF